MYLCSRQVVLGINVEYTGDGKVWFGFVSLQLSGNHRPYMDMGNDGRSEPIFFDFPFSIALFPIFVFLKFVSMNAEEIIGLMESMADEQQRAVLTRFFKTGTGQYGEGDSFLGIKVPVTREVVKEAKGLPLSEIQTLLDSHWHEVRLCGFLILVASFESLCKKKVAARQSSVIARDEIIQFYLDNASRANNWDLVDLSVIKIIGNWLLLPTCLGNEPGNTQPSMNREYKISVLDSLADSDCLWKQRMSIVCTWKTSQNSEPEWCRKYALRHLHHEHDLMHKAVGWMLREMGSRCDVELLRDFLRDHSGEMPRTMLRYAIEKLPEDERQYWLGRR